MNRGPEFGSERVVSRITSRSVKTLQKDRQRGRGFPYYRFGRQILYDRNEVRAIIRASRVDVDRTKTYTADPDFHRPGGEE